MTVTEGKPGRAALHLARAASLAPSPHNSQPWFFVEEGHDRAFEVHADAGRRMPLTDPGGREMVIACGAALLNVRTAVRHLGFRPLVDVLPEAADQRFLARVSFGAHAAPTDDEESPARALSLRHTHRGPFGPEPVTEALLAELRDRARAEGAVLQVLDVPEKVGLLARLVDTAERADRTDLWRAVELAHRTDLWRAVELAHRVGPTGVPVGACRAHPDLTLLAGRDYLGLSRRYTVSKRRRGVGTGIVAVLCTPYDQPADWLLAGQALQRVLLHAAGHGVMAAFHTQPLERPELREEVRRKVTAGRYPQMVLRLGRPPHVCPTPRRPLDRVLTRRPAPLVR
ncbi:Acg family FMN-binding oxidoreductase [Streptomyces griseorubiginosus]|uniref:Acg family FMN-binding oxidoreductase n=1 Tax=Streptomyces griseorubiginosus TaxID=67304 RepID=UPI0033E28296